MGRAKSLSPMEKEINNPRLCGFQIIVDHWPVICGSCNSSALRPKGPDVCADHIGQFTMPNGR
eukprot:scaffold5896_cov220-Chaetoceros_neogracile.AAC.4